MGELAYLLSACFTLCLIWGILRRVEKKKGRKVSKVINSQIDYHESLKVFFADRSYRGTARVSQYSKHEEDKDIKIVIVEDTAYWVADHQFYSAVFSDGEVLSETTAPVNTADMSGEELDKMLFILDGLKEKDS